MNKKNGFIYLTVLFLLVTLSFTILQIFNTTKIKYNRVNEKYNKLKAEYNLNSGLNIAVKLLKNDNRNTDNKNDIWNMKKIPLYFNETDNITISIEDENSKFNLNFLINNQGVKWPDYTNTFRNLLYNAGFEDKITDNIIDWIDFDKNPEINGSENNYYNHLKIGYNSYNKYLKDFRTLNLIKNMEYNDTGISRFITIYGNGKININTCSLKLLEALLESSEFNLIKSVDDYRNKVGFNNLEEFKKFSLIDDRTYSIIKNKISVASDVFKIVISSNINNREYTETSYVERNSLIKIIRKYINLL